MEESESESESEFLSVSSSIESLWHEIRALNLGTPPHIDHLPTPPTPMRFLRQYVAQNKPCKISNAVNHWPALSLWPSKSYLSSKLTSTSPVSIHITPNGNADSLAPNPQNKSLCFASAHVDKLPFKEALKMVSKSVENNRFVAYLQQQNDCFRSEYGELKGDCDDEILWASEAMGCEPEAVNLWVGNRFSNTSFHKDHYENIYVVVSGEKRFLLMPPTDVHRMYVREYPAAQYCYEKATGVFHLELEDPIRYVPWCSVDPYPSPENKQTEIDKFPLYFNGPKPFEVTVKAGEMLYLPSMWFHHVTQSPNDSGLTIAINYWYDMQFDIKYAYFNFLQSLPYSISKNPNPTLCTMRNVESSVCSSSEDESVITTFVEKQDENGSDE